MANETYNPFGETPGLKDNSEAVEKVNSVISEEEYKKLLSAWDTAVKTHDASTLVAIGEKLIVLVGKFI